MCQVMPGVSSAARITADDAGNWGIRKRNYNVSDMLSLSVCSESFLILLSGVTVNVNALDNKVLDVHLFTTLSYSKLWVNWNFIIHRLHVRRVLITSEAKWTNFIFCQCKDLLITIKTNTMYLQQMSTDGGKMGLTSWFSPEVNCLNIIWYFSF